MHKRNDTFLYFLLFLFLSVVIFLLSASGGLKSTRNILEKTLIPIQSLYKLFNFSSKQIGSALEKENRELIKKLVDQAQLQKENQALKDQFESVKTTSLKLIPAKIIGTSAFIPGVSAPENFVLDKGEKEGIKKGMGVIFKDNIIGKISDVTYNLSKVILVINKSSSFTASLVNSETLGVIKGKGNDEMTLENVLLSENLNANDIVITKGDINEKAIGFPRGLVVGKIVSIEKKPSSLFQSAKVKSLVDFSKLETVFVVVP